MPLISIADGALFAERHGTGPPRVLALHGWGRRGSDFNAVLAGMNALALDLPGFGASPPPPEAMGAAGYAELVGPAYDLFEDPPVVVGHSFGGRVAVARQHAHSDAARGLVLVACPLVRRQGPRSRPPLAYRLARAAHRLGLLSDVAMESQRKRHGSADYRAASGAMRQVLVRAVNESYEAEVASLQIPVHLLWGADDTEVPPSVAERAARLIADSGGSVELEVLEGVGHHVPLSAPEPIRAALESMIDRVTP